MSITSDALYALATTLQIEVPAPHTVTPGQVITASIAPQLSQMRVPFVSDQVINAIWLAKNLRIADTATGLQTLPLDRNLPAILGPMPIVDLTRVPPLAVSGIPGLLGQLAASIPLPLQLPVGLRVKWMIKDANNKEVPPGSGVFSLAGGVDGPSRDKLLGTLGTDTQKPPQIATTGVPAISLTFAPATSELVVGVAPTTATYTINAIVQLFVGVDKLPDPNIPQIYEISAAVDLPPVSITIPAIPIPWILAMFRHASYKPSEGRDEGFALVMVPSNSLIGDLAQFQSVLKDVTGVVAGLQQFTNFGTLWTGLQSVLNNVIAQPYIQIRATDSISNLADVQLKDTSWSDWRGINANDEVDSILVVGPSGYSANCFNNTGLSVSEGAFTITLGDEFYVAIPYLGDPSNPKAMEFLVSDPAEKATVTNEGESFHDELSSVQLKRP
ncbi:MAG: hypothetical protein M3Z54_12945 [Gemmatimonadota bacterium]|nr:hypothetical protein [Gemmatimonadota bacterium]